MKFLITEPTKGYLDGYDGQEWEWTADKKKAWRLSGSDATRKALKISKLLPLVRVEPVK